MGIAATISIIIIALFIILVILGHSCSKKYKNDSAFNDYYNYSKEKEYEETARRSSESSFIEDYVTYKVVDNILEDVFDDDYDD